MFEFLSCFTSLLILQVLHSQNITISTQLGDVTGSNMNGEILVFKGIPYVEHQPIEQYRFAPSQMKTSPYDTIPYNALQFGPTCPKLQPNAEPVSESCLFINIFTRINASNDSNLPVLVHIHGGGFIGDSSSNPELNYDNPPFIYVDKMIFVSFNYRLAGLGFLPLPQILEETNGTTNGGLNGIADQITALTWVQKYISDFGGDPNKVTIMGISAGGESICHLVASPHAINLFNNAIIHSAPCITIPEVRQLEMDIGYQYASQVLNDLHLPTNLDELRQLPYEDLITAYISKRTIYGEIHAKQMSIDQGLVLTIDGYVLNQTTFDFYTDFNVTTDTLNANNIIMGFTSQDQLLGQPFFASANAVPRNSEQDKNYFDAYFKNTETMKLMKEMYYPLDDFVAYVPIPPPPETGLPAWNETSDIQNRWYQMAGDTCYLCATLKTAQTLVSKLDDNSTRIYVFNLKGIEPYYTTHGSDIGYLFTNMPPNGNGPPFFSLMSGVPIDYDLSSLMIQIYVNFVVHNGEFETENINLNWMEFGQYANVMEFKADNTTMVSNYTYNYRNNVCNYWVNNWHQMNDMCKQNFGVVKAESDAMDNSIIIIVAVSIPAVCLICILMFYVYRKNRKNNSRNDNNYANKYGTLETEMAD